MKTAITIFGTILGLVIPGSAAADWFANLEAGIRHDSNLGNARMAADIVSDSALTTSFAGGHILQLDNGDSIIFQGHLAQETYDRFHGMSNLAAGGGVDYKTKLGLGPYAPRLGAFISSEHLGFGDQVRNGWLNRVGIRGARRVGERWDLSAEGSIEQRSSDRTMATEPGFAGDVFSQKSRNLLFRADYVHSDSTFMFIGYGLRKGDVVTTTQGDSDSAYDVARAITSDRALGSDAYAYRIGGTTCTINAGIGMAISNHFVISLSYLRHVTHAEGGNNYQKSLPGLLGSYSF